MKHIRDYIGSVLVKVAPKNVTKEADEAAERLAPPKGGQATGHIWNLPDLPAGTTIMVGGTGTGSGGVVYSPAEASGSGAGGYGQMWVFEAPSPPKFDPIWLAKYHAERERISYARMVEET